MMKRQIQYDLTTFEGALESLGKYLDLTERQLGKYIAEHKNNWNVDEFLEIYNVTHEKLFENELLMISLHVTTNNDECASIKKQGLVNLRQAIMLDTPLSRYLEDHDIKIDIDSKTLKHRGRCFDINDREDLYTNRTALEWIAFKLYEDYQVNSFFAYENVLTYGGMVHRRPEFLLNLGKVLGGNVEFDWEKDKSNKTYIVKVISPLSDSAIQTFIHRSYIQGWDRDAIEVLKRKWIIHNSLRVLNETLFSRTIPEIPNEMNFDVTVSPESILKVYTPEQYFEEYQIEE